MFSDLLKGVGFVILGIVCWTPLVGGLIEWRWKMYGQDYKVSGKVKLLLRSLGIISAIYGFVLVLSVLSK